MDISPSSRDLGGASLTPTVEETGEEDQVPADFHRGLELAEFLVGEVCKRGDHVEIPVDLHAFPILAAGRPICGVEKILEAVTLVPAEMDRFEDPDPLFLSNACADDLADRCGNGGLLRIEQPPQIFVDLALELTTKQPHRHRKGYLDEDRNFVVPNTCFDAT